MKCSMEMEKYNALGMDFENLMSCIHCHEDTQDDDVILATLKTIVDICSQESCGRDAFREEGGLDFLVEFLFLTDNTKLLEHILKTLAFVIDENVTSQMYLSKKSVFEVLQAIWKKQSFPIAVQRNALVLVSTIIYHNSTAQNFVFETGLLQDLLNMYEHYAQGLMINGPCTTSNLDSSALNFWMNINSALCFAVNNPQNEKNQDVCKNIFPVCLRILEFSSNSAVKSSVASFLSLTISDNASCQNYFSSCDGFLVLKRCFQKYFDTLLMDMKICNGMTGKETYQAINNIVGIISPACLDHEKNAAVCGDIGILTIMIKFLLMETCDCQLNVKIILSLGHCIAACCTNKSYVLETANFDTFLKKSLHLGDAELSSACKYLLKVCLANKESPESNLDYTEDREFDDVSPLKCDLEYLNDAIKNNFVLNQSDYKIPSFKQNSTKVSSIRSSSVKKIKRNSRSLERAYSSSSSSYKKAPQRRRISKTSKRSQNKVSVKKECLSNSSAIQCDLLSDPQYSPRGKKYSTSIHSNTNLDSSKSKSYKKERNQSSHTYDKFSKQDLISNKMPFSDFLTKETKTSSPKFQETDYIKTVSDSLISEWHMHNKTNMNESVKLSANNSTKVESIFQDISNSFSPYEKNCTNQNSTQEKYPRLFKKKKERISSDISSSSSSEYSFTPYNVKNCISQENANASQLGYHMPYLSEINFPETSKNSKSKSATDNYQNNCMKWNSKGKLLKHVRKPLFSLNAENQAESENQSEFSLKLFPTKFENCQKENDGFLSCNIVPVTGKENSTGFRKFNKASQHQHEKSLMDSGFSSNHVLQSSRTSDTYLGNWYQSTNQKNFPQSSGIFGNPCKKKRSWSCSSIGTCNESLSPFSSSLNSSRRVQVIVLPKETCEQHGLSASIKLLEVVSLEDIKG